MPLVIITGFPCSGKSHRAAQIIKNLKDRISDEGPTGARRTVLHIPSSHARHDEELTLPSQSSHDDNLTTDLKEGNVKDLRNTVYNSAAAEKTARAEEFSTAKRALSKDCIVVVDALNYIKGYRYQLWCEAKAAGTRCCVVHVAAREDEVEEYNTKRLQVWQWNTLVPGDKGNSVATATTGSFGGLMPESHTAIYGDRVVGVQPASKSLSIDGGTEVESSGKTLDNDNMTLKSLYIREEAEFPIRQNTTASSNDESTHPATFPPQTTTTDEPTIPPPSSSSAPPYTPATLKSLCMRYEPPSPFTRWDTPLFTVPTSDSHPPHQAIWDALFPQPGKQMSKKAISQQRRAEPSHGPSENLDSVRPHAATVLPQATTAEALQTLEAATGDVVSALLAAARKHNLADSGEGGTLTFTVPTEVPRSKDISSPRSYTSTKTPSPQPRTTDHLSSSSSPGSSTPSTHPADHPPLGGETEFEIEIEIDIPPGLILSQPLLQRLRRKYTAVQRGGIAHGQSHVRGRRAAVEGFVRFVVGEWATG